MGKFVQCFLQVPPLPPVRVPWKRYLSVSWHSMRDNRGRGMPPQMKRNNFSIGNENHVIISVGGFLFASNICQRWTNFSTKGNSLVPPSWSQWSAHRIGRLVSRTYLQGWNVVLLSQYPLSLLLIASVSISFPLSYLSFKSWSFCLLIVYPLKGNNFPTSLWIMFLKPQFNLSVENKNKTKKQLSFSSVSVTIPRMSSDLPYLGLPSHVLTLSLLEARDTVMSQT